MANGFDHTSPQMTQQNHVTKNQTNGATYIILTDKQGPYYHHPQDGRIKVVALFCNCGRSVLVRAKDAQGTSIVCGRCNSPFRWQQLTFGLD